MNRNVALTAFLVVGCAGAPPTVSSGAANTVTPPESAPTAPSFPIAASALLPQFAPNPFAGGFLIALDRDRTLFGNSDGLAVLESDGTVVGRSQVGYDTTTLAVVDRAQTTLFSAYRTDDLRTGRSEPVDHGYRLGCSPDASTCAELADDADDGVPRISIVDTATGDVVATAMLRATSFGIAPSEAPSTDDSMYPDGSAFVDGRLAAFTTARADGTYLCVLDAASDPSARCGRVAGARILMAIDADRGIARFVQDDSGELEDDSGEEDEETELADSDDAGRVLPEGGSQLYDLRTLAPLARPVPPRAASRGPEPLVLEELWMTNRVLVAATGEVVFAPERSTIRPFAGIGAFATVEGSTVSFFDASAHATATASLAEPFDATGDLYYALSPTALHIVSASSGLAVIHPGDTGVSFSRLQSDAGYELAAGTEAFVIRTAEAVVSVGASGLGDDDFVPSESLSRSEGGSERRTFARALHARRPRAQFPISTELATEERIFAYVEGRQVHVTDAEGHDLVRPTSLPRSVDASRCSSLAFLTDVDLVLSGRAPCVPTRIRFRSRTTSPLGLAYVRFDTSRDGSKVALLADHRFFLLDGRTGETLSELDPGLEHPRSVAFFESERRIWISGEDGWVFIDATSSPPRTNRVDPGARATFDETNDLVLRQLDDGSYEWVPLFGGAVNAFTISDAGASDDASVLGEASVDSASIPGFVAIRRPRGISFVRIRDRATLDLLVLGSGEMLALAYLEGGVVRDVVPEASPLLRVRTSDSDRTLAPVPSSNGELDAAVRRFFADESTASN